MKKQPLLGATLAGFGVSPLQELVSCYMQRVSCFPSSAGVIWKEPSLLQNKSLKLAWQLTQWIDFSRKINRPWKVISDQHSALSHLFGPNELSYFPPTELLESDLTLLWEKVVWRLCHSRLHF